LLDPAAGAEVEGARDSAPNGEVAARARRPRRRPRRAGRDRCAEVEAALGLGARHRQLEEEERDQRRERVGRVELVERGRPLAGPGHVPLAPKGALEAGRVVPGGGEPGADAGDRGGVGAEHPPTIACAPRAAPAAAGTVGGRRGPRRSARFPLRKERDPQKRIPLRAKDP